VETGTDVAIFKIFLPKNLAKILAFFAQATASFCKKKIIIASVFEKNANCFAENWQKSQKIVIITSTPRRLTFQVKEMCGHCKQERLDAGNGVVAVSGIAEVGRAGQHASANSLECF
jgi:hypothetical protein